MELVRKLFDVLDELELNNEQLEDVLNLILFFVKYNKKCSKLN